MLLPNATSDAKSFHKRLHGGAGAKRNLTSTVRKTRAVSDQNPGEALLARGFQTQRVVAVDVIAIADLSD